MKEILIDIYKIKDLYSGLGQFSFNYAQEIIKQLPDDYNVNFLMPPNFDAIVGIPERNRLNTNFQKRFFPNLNRGFDVWHSLYQFPSHMPGKKSKHILTIHDLNFLTEKSKSKAAKYLKKLQRNVDRADVITAVSNLTRTQLEEFINLKGKSVHIIYNGVKISQFKEARKPKFIKKSKLFFSLGVFKEKKNFHVLLSVMKHFNDYQLIIAGNNNTNYGNFLSKEIIKLKLTDKVVLPGKISEEEKFWLYKNCEAFILPSSIEGFGLPVIEAMFFGKPVFLSKYGSLPEIGGENAFYFENFKQEYMVSFLNEKLDFFRKNETQLSIKIKKYAEKFSWETCIKKYLSIYN